jgi:serine/threonine protein kinase
MTAGRAMRATELAGSETETRTEILEELLTSPGSAVGTIAYMSPEQARAEEVDARTDIFSLGAVLYEMTTGKLPFPGRTSATIFDAILNKQPEPPSLANPEVPPQLGRIILKALEKSPSARYQTAPELLADLKQLRREIESGRISSAPIAPARHRRPWVLLLGVVAASVMLLGGITLWWFVGQPRVARDMREWRAITDFADSAVSPALSPDGRMLTFIRGPGTFFTKGEIYVKLLPDGDPVQYRYSTGRTSPPTTPVSPDCGHSSST